MKVLTPLKAARKVKRILTAEERRAMTDRLKQGREKKAADGPAAA